MSFDKTNIIPLFFLLLISFGSVADDTVVTSSRTQMPNTMVDNKPITIDADNQQIDIEKNIITFSGNVVIVQEGLTIKADKVVITEMQDTTKQVITAYGKPVNFKQVMQEKNKDVTGHSDKVIYHVKQNLVTLDGRAELFQQDNHIVSALITYDVNKQLVVAKPGGNGRVKTTIIPNQVKEKNK